MWKCRFLGTILNLVWVGNLNQEVLGIFLGLQFIRQEEDTEDGCSSGQRLGGFSGYSALNREAGEYYAVRSVGICEGHGHCAYKCQGCRNQACEADFKESSLRHTCHAQLGKQIEHGGQLHKITRRGKRAQFWHLKKHPCILFFEEWLPLKGSWALWACVTCVMCSLNLEACVVFRIFHFRVFHFSLRRSCGPMRGCGFLKVTDLAGDRNRTWTQTSVGWPIIPLCVTPLTQATSCCWWQKHINTNNPTPFSKQHNQLQGYKGHMLVHKTTPERKRWEWAQFELRTAFERVLSGLPSLSLVFVSF